jgi:hypothetical protein
MNKVALTIRSVSLRMAIVAWVIAASASSSSASPLRHSAPPFWHHEPPQRQWRGRLSDDACAVAGAAISIHASDLQLKKLVVTRFRPPGPSKPRPASAHAGSWQGIAPPSALLRAWELAPDADVLRCASLKDILPSDSLPSMPGAKLSLGLPVIGANGREAVVEIETYKGNMDAEGELLYFRRAATGDWRAVGRLSLWMT